MQFVSRPPSVWRTMSQEES